MKVDWCGGNKEKLDPAVQYAEIARAIDKAETVTGQRLYFSFCDWGNNSPWTWAANVGGAPADIWRTSGDIVAPIVPHEKHSGRLASFAGVLSNFDQGHSSRSATYRLLQRSRHDGGRDAWPYRRAEPGPYEPLGDLRQLRCWRARISLP